MCNQASNVTAEDAFEQLAGSRTLDLVFAQSRVESERPIPRFMSDGGLRFQLPEQRLHRAVRDGFSRVQCLGNLAGRRATAIPENLHDAELHPPEPTACHSGPSSSGISSTRIDLLQ